MWRVGSHMRFKKLIVNQNMRWIYFFIHPPTNVIKLAFFCVCMECIAMKPGGGEGLGIQKTSRVRLTSFGLNGYFPNINPT